MSESIFQKPFRSHSFTLFILPYVCNLVKHYNIQMDFVDHYNNLTLKTISAIKFALTSRQAPVYSRKKYFINEYAFPPNSAVR